MRSVIVLLALSACTAGTTAQSGSPPPRPPPKPGSSITHSKLCECRTCSVASCCTGDAPDDAENTCTADEQTGEMQCGLSMTSCVGRCNRQVWRVLRVESCESKRPASCCEA